MKYALYVLLLLFAGTAFADGDAATSTSGALANTKSSAGSVGYIDNGTHINEAPDLNDRAPGVFSAGITAGGSNPCVVSIGAGLSVPGGGLNYANAYNDSECNVRESLRLMASISSSAETSNQILLREISCQSLTLWDAMERTYMETQDERYMCSNDRPEDPNETIAFRRANPKTGVVAKQQVVSQGINNGFFD